MTVNNPARTGPRTSHHDPLTPYDAVLLLSFGGPEAPEEVMPFLRRVTAGRGVPDSRLEVVAEHYYHFGGASPINAQNRALAEALRRELAVQGSTIPVLCGNRNSEPFLVDTLRSARSEGLLRLCVLTTSAYSSYSSCRQYREDLAAAVAELEVAGADFIIDKVRPYALTPAFVSANADRVAASVAQLQRSGDFDPSSTMLLTVTHSIPTAMDDTSGPGDGGGNLYTRQHLRVSAQIEQAVAKRTGVALATELVFCSRSGSPRTPWLEPDIGARIVELAGEGVRTIIAAPIGFISDHMEVINDLDREASEVAAKAGVRFVRVPTAGTGEDFVHGLVDLLLERAQVAREDPVQLSRSDTLDVRPSICDVGCCPNLAEAIPALCGRD